MAVVVGFGVGVGVGVGFLQVMSAAGLYVVVNGSRLTSLPLSLKTRVTTILNPLTPSCGVHVALVSVTVEYGLELVRGPVSASMS